MTELIKITSRNGQRVVSAKELHHLLEVRRDFSKWCKQMFDYGFEDGQDFSPVLAESTGGRPLQDYALTMDTAKEIAMLQRSERGRFVRRYFIECEKKLQEKTLQANNIQSLKARYWDILQMRKALSREAATIRCELRKADPEMQALLLMPILMQGKLFTA